SGRQRKGVVVIHFTPLYASGHRSINDVVTAPLGVLIEASRKPTLEYEAMPKKSKTGKQSELDLWVAPRHSLKGPAAERAWENRPGGPPNSRRYLELADLALGVKKP